MVYSFLGRFVFNTLEYGMGEFLVLGGDVVSKAKGILLFRAGVLCYVVVGRFAGTAFLAMCTVSSNHVSIVVKIHLYDPTKALVEEK